MREYGLTEGHNRSITKLKEMMELDLNLAAFSGSIKRKLMPLLMKRLKPNLIMRYGQVVLVKKINSTIQLEQKMLGIFFSKKVK